jgi:hypothetical protein
MLMTLMWVIFGAIAGIFFLLFAISEPSEAPSLIVMVIFYFIGIFVYGFFSGVGFAIYAWVYNLVAGRMGGLQIELERVEAPKRKRDDFFDDESL